MLLTRLYIGFIIFTCVENFAVSSGIWITSPWALLVTYPMYIAHFFFFTTIASKFKRSSVSQLYFWGAIIGLYETWITKVIWQGYSGEGFAFGGFWFGLHETIGLVLVWHPFFAFLLPLATGYMIFRSFPNTTDDPGLDYIGLKKLFFSKNMKSGFLMAFLIIIASVTSGLNGQSITNLLIVYGPSLIIIVGGYFLLKWLYSKSEAQTTSSSNVFVLNTGGLILTSVYLFIFYILSYFFIHPDWLPAWYIQLLTLIFYFVFLMIIFLKNRQRQESKVINGSLERLGTKTSGQDSISNQQLGIVSQVPPNEYEQYDIERHYGLESNDNDDEIEGGEMVTTKTQFLKLFQILILFCGIIALALFLVMIPSVTTVMFVIVACVTILIGPIFALIFILMKTTTGITS